MRNKTWYNSECFRLTASGFPLIAKVRKLPTVQCQRNALFLPSRSCIVNGEKYGRRRHWAHRPLEPVPHLPNLRQRTVTSRSTARAHIEVSWTHTNNPGVGFRSIVE